MNTNSATDQYFKQPDYDIRSNTVARSANGTTEFKSAINTLIPLGAPLKIVKPQFVQIQVSQQLQKRKFYFAYVFDQVQRWTFQGTISFLLNNSPQFTWEIFSEDVVTRAGNAAPINPNPVLMSKPQDRIMPPFWVDVQKVNPPNNPVLPADVGVGLPQNESLNLKPLAACCPINTVDSVWTQFPAQQYTPGISGTQALIYYTVVMYPYHLDIMCDTIQFDLGQSSFSTDGNVNNPGFLWCALACNSSRY